MAAIKSGDNREAAQAPKPSASGATAARNRPPSVGECLNAAASDPFLSGLKRNWLRTLIRDAIAELRRNVLADGAAVEPAANSQTRLQMVAEVIRRASVAARADQPLLRPVVNATGVIIHTNLGRSLLAESAIAAMAEAARSPVNLEYDLATGERGERDRLIEDRLCALTGAEAAAVVNNNAAAVLLVLNTLAEGREVIVSRGELIEIGGAFRIPDVMARSGARLREAGTTNRTHVSDYAAAITPETALLLKVHPSNYRIVGFTAEVALRDLAAIGAAHGLPVIEDLGSGALIDLTAYGLPREPIVAERIAAGAALVTFSGDKLLGGPQAGLIAGRRDLIERVRRNPLRRALRCDKLTLAALAATLELYQRSTNLAAELPVLRMLSLTIAELIDRADAARSILAARLGTGFTIEAVASEAAIGSGAMPEIPLPSRALRLTHPSLSARAIAAILRRARPPVIARIQDDAVFLDMRTIEDPARLAITVDQSDRPSERH
jgi:L-seryl-tRNA(Ser) seleniumtransferase